MVYVDGYDVIDAYDAAVLLDANKDLSFQTAHWFGPIRKYVDLAKEELACDRDLLRAALGGLTEGTSNGLVYCPDESTHLSELLKLTRSIQGYLEKEKGVKNPPRIPIYRFDSPKSEINYSTYEDKNGSRHPMPAGILTAAMFLQQHAGTIIPPPVLHVICEEVGPLVIQGKAPEDMADFSVKQDSEDGFDYDASDHGYNDEEEIEAPFRREASPNIETEGQLTTAQGVSVSISPNNNRNDGVTTVVTPTTTVRHSPGKC
jgi:hypothetical protein